MFKKDIFTRILRIIFIIIGVGYGIYPKLKIRNSSKAFGRITDIKTAVNKEMKKNNSKYAFIEIIIDGKNYISEKRIQVEMYSEVGDEVEVLYDKDNPSNMALGKRKFKTIVFIGIGLFIVFYKVIEKWLNIL